MPATLGLFFVDFADTWVGTVGLTFALDWHRGDGFIFFVVCDSRCGSCLRLLDWFWDRGCGAGSASLV